MDQVGRTLEGHTAGQEAVVGRLDVIDPEVDDRGFLEGTILVRGDEETHPGAIEEGETAGGVREGEEMGEAERVAKERHGAVHVGGLEADLPDAQQQSIPVGHGRSLLDRVVERHRAPVTDAGAAHHLELRGDISDTVLLLYRGQKRQH